MSFLRAHQLQAESQLEFDFLLLCGGSQQSMAGGGGACGCVCFCFCSLPAPPLTSEAVGTCDAYLTHKKELPFFV